MATSLRGRSEASKAAICETVEREVWPMFASGQIKPVVDTVLPLDQAPEAHRMLAESRAFGKVVLQVAPTERT